MSTSGKSEPELTEEDRLERRRAQNRAHYQRNREAYKARGRRWREQNPGRDRELQAARRAKDPEKFKAISHDWYEANKQRAAETTRRNRLKRYGLTLEQFDEMLIAQIGLCLICEEQMKQPVVDHDHDTEAVRGLLCQPCNAALGIFRDDPKLLTRAISYLTRSSSGSTSTQSSEQSSRSSTSSA